MNIILRFLEPYLLTASASVFSIESAILISIALGLVFLIFYTTKDVISRSDSFLFMLFSLLLVTALPVVGFCAYILMRPAHTKLQRAMYAEVLALKAEVHALKPKVSITKKVVGKLTKATTKKKNAAKNK